MPFVFVEARFWDMRSPVSVFGTRPLYSLPHMEVVCMDALHNPCIYKSSFDFLYKIAKASDIQIVLVCLLLVMHMKGQEELRSFCVVLVVRYKIQGVTIIIVPRMKALQSSLSDVQDALLVDQVVAEAAAGQSSRPGPPDQERTAHAASARCVRC